MGYAENFELACPLDSLSWVQMEAKARLCRLACRFLNEEEKLKKLKEKGDWAVTAGVVRPWLLSIYEPPRGQLSGMIPALMTEISRQREIRSERRSNRPWKAPKLTIEMRRNAVAPHLYGVITDKNAEGKRFKVNPHCVDLATVSGILMALDAAREANLRLYMRHRETGRVKVIITDIRVSYSSDVKWNLTRALLKLAPLNVHRTLFGGHLIAVDFDRNGFTIDGTFVPFRHVAQIVEGPKRALRTRKTVDTKRPEPEPTEGDDDEE